MPVIWHAHHVIKCKFIILQTKIVAETLRLLHRVCIMWPGVICRKILEQQVIHAHTFPWSCIERLNSRLNSKSFIWERLRCCSSLLQNKDG